MPSLDVATHVLSLFADATRVRLTTLLARQELTVAELTSITQLAQSRVSTHLGKLREAEVLRDRRVGASTFYGLNDGAMPEQARKVWALLEHGVSDAVIEGDRVRCASVLKAREKAAGWPDAVAGAMERHYSPGRTWESLARGMLGLMRLGDVLDAGSGDGAIAELIAERSKSITCLDASEKMIAAATQRLAPHAHVRCIVGDVMALPFDRPRFDQVLLFHVLTHAASPAVAVAEAARVLRPGGTLAVVALDAHDHADVTASYHHVHAGFRPAALRKLLQKAGLVVERCEVTSRERRHPHFQVVSAFADKP